jgi:tetratricopeptide (TPR) repeat protein
MPLARYEKRLGDAGEIRALLAALESNQHRLGPHHPDTLCVVNQLADAYWRAGQIDRAVGLLDQVLDQLTSSLGPDHPRRVDVLSILGRIMFEQHHPDQASMVLREVLECRVRYAGANHPDSLAAKGDLAAALFELGEDEEAVRLQTEAYESARTHLGKTHSITCVLAWNRALNYEQGRELDSAQALIVNELAWLLAEDPSSLEEDQRAIRSMLAERWNWNTATVC